MTEPSKVCSDCGDALPAGFPAGICPKCLACSPTLPFLEASGGRVQAPRSGSIQGEPASATDSSTVGSREPRSPLPEELQAWFPGLEIVELLGAGGMGAVYKARQPRLNRLVALKILTCPPELSADFSMRFEREAQVMARLNHPHIVTIFDFGEVDRSAAGLETIFFFLMEFVDGSDLNRLVRSGGMTAAEALAFVPQICEALQFAHDEGITHRDIKPANILVDRKGHVKIADFGLAKLIQGDETLAMGLTMTGTAMGTPQYMAPEQWEAPETVDHRADIYALGVVIYELLTGERPAGVFEPPSKKCKVDRRIDTVVMRAMEKEPERRYQRASEVKSEVTRVMDSAPGMPMMRRRRQVRAGALVVALVGLLGVAGWYGRPTPNQGSSDQAVDDEFSVVEAAATNTSVAAGASPLTDKPVDSPFPPGQWVRVASTEAEMEADPINRGKLKEGVRFVDGWMDATTCEVTPSIQLTGLAGKDHGVRFRGKYGSDPASWRGFTIMLRTGKGSSDDRAAYQFGLGGTDTPKPYLLVSRYAFQSRTSEPLAHMPLDSPPGPGDEFRMEFYVIGEKLVARFNDLNLPIASDPRLTSGEVFIKNSQFVRDVEGINLDGLSEAEALRLIGFEGSDLVPVSATAAATSDATAEEAGKSARAPLGSATKEAPFENSLGMKFVPVPGTDVLFCIHETRWRDYAAYAEENDGVGHDWRGQNHGGFMVRENPGDHPVGGVSWDDAQAFCAWLSKREGKTYRLPTDREWSIAVGIGDEEVWTPDTTPVTVFKPMDAFPWGKEWPPPPGAGNYNDESRREKAPREDGQYLDGYDDGYPTTAPVMRFEPNAFGLYDLGGNVWEWCEDWFSEAQKERVLRGGSFFDHGRSGLLSAYRYFGAPDLRGTTRGFRVVLEIGGPTSPSAAVSPPVGDPTATSPSALSLGAANPSVSAGQWVKGDFASAAPAENDPRMELRDGRLHMGEKGGMEEVAPTIAPALGSAANSLDADEEPKAALGGPRSEPPTKPGRLRATGTMLNGQPPDLSKYNAFDDFVDVAGTSDRWVALRSNGDTVSSNGLADFKGVRRIARSYGGEYCFIDVAGKIRFSRGLEMELPRVAVESRVVDAARAVSHGVALLEGGEAVVFGRRYDEAVGDPSVATGTGTPRWPKPPASALKNVKAVAAIPTHAAALHLDGSVSVWGWNGPIAWEPEAKMKGHLRDRNRAGRHPDVGRGGAGLGFSIAEERASRAAGRV